MRALTLYPEWGGFAIPYLGKNIENRTWPPPRETVGEVIAIHSGLSWGGQRKATADVVADAIECVTEAAYDAGWSVFCDITGYVLDGRVRAFIRNKSRVSCTKPQIDLDIRNIPVGAVTAVAQLAGCLRPHPGTKTTKAWWNPHCYGWILRNIKKLDRPVEIKGRQGLWTLPPHVEEIVRSQLHG